MKPKIAGKHLLYFGLFVVVLAIVQAQIWQNNYGGQLNVHCGFTSALNKVKSQHSDEIEDRQWLWECRNVVYSSFDDCEWTTYLINQCDHDYVLIGVKSYYDNEAKVRRWKTKCCKSSNHFVQHCRVSGYINSYDSYMDFSVDSPEVFTGFFSARTYEFARVSQLLSYLL